jgi:hypothetical protein
MVPTCIDDDKAAAAAVNRRTLNTYVRLPNYQNYWIEAGFAEEMLAIRQAIANKEDEKCGKASRRGMKPALPPSFSYLPQRVAARWWPFRNCWRCFVSAVYCGGTLPSVTASII